MIRIAMTAIAVFLGAAGSADAELLHAYDFETGVVDLAGGVDGTLVGSASVSGGVLELDGGWVEFGGEKLVPLSGSYTVGLFARIDVLSQPATEFISQGASIQLADPVGGFYLGTVGTGFAMRATDSWQMPDATFPSDGAFHHVALVVDDVAGESRLYLDGSLQDTLDSAIETTSLGLGTRFGRQFVAFDPELLIGALDNVVIYDEALSTGQVTALAAGAILAPAVPVMGRLGYVVLAVSVALVAVYVARPRVSIA
jgi:hypothetical protein